MSARAVGVVAVVASLVWGLLMGLAAFGCELGGSWAPGSRAAWAAPPWIALCAFGIALWRRSAWALLLAPMPSVLGVVVVLASRLEPRMFALAGCVVGLAGIGPRAPWMAPSLVSSLEASALLFLVFAAVVPGVGVATLLRSDGTVSHRARQLLPSRDVVVWMAVLVVLAGVVALTVHRWRPLPVGESLDAFRKYGPAPNEQPSHGLDAAQIENVKRSRLDRGDSPWLGPLLDQRLGPITWTSHPTDLDSDTHVVTATGHFPASVWRPRFDRYVHGFETCLDALRGNPKDEAFIKDWADWWSGRVPADAIRAKWVPYDPEVYRREMAEFDRGLVSAKELDKRWTARAALGPGAELYTGMVRCAQERPKIDEESFSRVVLQWQCRWLQCQWDYVDPDAWERVLPGPCRDTGPRRCVEEAFTYLATGEI